MSKIKYTKEVTDRAIELRLSGMVIPEIVMITGMKKPSLQKLFQRNNIILNEQDKALATTRRWLNYQPISNGQKKCSKCGDLKNVDEFHKNVNRLSGATSSCKECFGLFYKQNADKIKARSNVYRKKNEKRKKLSDKNHYSKNKQIYMNRAKEWGLKNPEKIKEIRSSYDRRNKKQKNARNALYRALKIKATPKWVSKDHLEEISRIYQNCPTGFHVDHIVPLNGKNVRGLHVPWNLQYLSAFENMKKSNKL